MHVELLQEHLVTAVNQLQKIVPNKPQLPILTSILFKTLANGVQLSATDLFVGMQTEVMGKVIAEGTIAIPGKIFRDYIVTLPPGKITLTLEDTVLTIGSGKNTTTIQCVPSEEFPEFPVIEGEELELGVDALQKIDELVRFTASIDPTRPVLTTLLFKFKEEGLEVVGTDGFRLATLLFPGQHVGINTQLLVSAKALSEIVRISTQLQERKIVFVVSEKLKQVLFTIGNTTLFIRLIEGEFPPYHKIIPPEFALRVSINGPELEEHLKRAMIFSRDTANIVKLSIKDKQLTVSATSPTYGTHEGVINVDVKTGDEGVIAFNARYVLDFLSAVKPEQVEFSMNESLTPAQFRPEGLEEYVYIVMPFRVNE